MRSHHILWSLPSVLLFACSSGRGGTSSAPTSWDCSQASVPNGTAVECTSATSSALGDYTCATGAAACPPADVNAGPAPDCGGDLTGACAPGDDGGYPPVSQGGADAGSSMPDAGASVSDAAGGGACTCTEDAGPVGQGGGANGNGNGGGNGNANGGNNGNGHGNGNGGGGGSSNDQDAGGYGSGGDTGGSGSNGGNGGDGGPPWHCVGGGDGTVTCQQPPSCAPGSHASACGACVPDGCTDDCVPPSSGGCWVTGGGFIASADGQNSFGGNAMPMKAGNVRGEWEHVDHGTGDKAHGQAQYIFCRHVDEPGPGQPSGPSHDFDMNQVYFGGPARWFTNGAWADGYWFDVMAEDHGEGKGKKAGGPDYYHFTIRQISGNGVSGAVVYDTENDLGGGNIQMHPPNNGHPYTASSLPSWVSLQP